MTPTVLTTIRCFLLMAALSSGAFGQDLELARNGNAEKFVAGKAKNDPAIIVDWLTEAGNWESMASVEEGLVAASGNRYMRSRGKDSPTLNQVITLPTPSKGAKRYLLFEGKCRSFDSADLAWASIQILSDNGKTLQSSRTQVESNRAWTRFRIILPIGSSAQTARIELRGTYRSGNTCDVGFDDISARMIEFRNSPAAKSMSHLIELSDSHWPSKAKLNGTTPVLINWSRATSKLKGGKNAFAVLRCQLTGNEKAPAHLTLRALDHKKRLIAAATTSTSQSNERIRLEVALNKRVRFISIALEGKGAAATKPYLRRACFSKKRGRHSRFALLQEKLEFSPLSDGQSQEILRKMAQTAEPRAIAYLESKIADGASETLKASAFEALALTAPTRIEDTIKAMRAGENDHLIDSWIFLRDCLRAKKAPRLEELIANKHATTTAHRAALNHLIHPDERDIVEKIRRWSKMGSPDHTGSILEYAGSRLPLKDIIDDVINPLLRRSANSTHRFTALKLLGQAQHPRYLDVIGSLGPLYETAYQRASLMQYCGTFRNRLGLSLAVKIATGRGAAEQRSLDRAMAVVPRDVLFPFIFEECLFHPDELVRLTSIARLQLSAKKHSFTPSELAKVLKLTSDSSRRVTLESIDLIALLPRTKGIDERFRLLMSNRDPVIAAESLNAAWGYFKGKGDVREICLQIAASSFDWAPRVAAINLIGLHMPDEGAGILFDNLTNSRRQVRAAAFEALTYVRRKKTVDALISRLKHEQGITLHVLRACLKSLTNFDWGAKEERWLTWWDRQRDTFKLPPRPKNGILISRAEGYASYYGISIQSRRVVFVIDTSGSMEAVERGKSRMERAQNQLIRVIEQFDKNTRFLVIAFSDDPYTYTDRLLRATRAERKDAGKRIKELFSEGGTNVFDAIELAMDIKGVESIFLLSDGAPSAGRVVNPEEILDEVKRLNRYSRIRINTISIGGTSTMKNFMQRLAAQNYGSYASF